MQLNITSYLFINIHPASSIIFSLFSINDIWGKICFLNYSRNHNTNKHPWHSIHKGS